VPAVVQRAGMVPEDDVTPILAELVSASLAEDSGGVYRMTVQGMAVLVAASPDDAAASEALGLHTPSAFAASAIPGAVTA
jgi:hypothetical protein